MSRREVEREVQRSVLDRLVDEDPSLAGDPTMTYGESVRLLKVALRRDMEWLLNTRRMAVAVPDEFVELRESLFTYGLLDISTVSRDAAETRGRLARAVEEAVRIFEPRLESVRVVFGDEKEDSFLRFHYVVEAVLRLDPTPERIVFDTVLDLANSTFEVASSGASD